MALRGMDMFVRFGMAPKVMNPWTRGFKMHPLVGRPHGQTGREGGPLDDDPFETPALHHEFIVSINTRHRTAPSF